MSVITFPTQPHPYGIAVLGTPERAESCRCEPAPWPIIDSDTCLRCGRHPEETISQTWAERARLIARRQAA